MSAVTFEWTQIETEARATHSLMVREEHCREEQFRTALDNYIAAYVDCQERRAETIGRTARTSDTGYTFARFAEWLRHQVARRNDKEAFI